jgi:hypothetical protein
MGAEYLVTGSLGWGAGSLWGGFDFFNYHDGGGFGVVVGLDHRDLAIFLFRVFFLV